MNSEEAVVKRLAIIICSPGPQDNYLPGSLNDPVHVTRYLMSPKGGMWKASEIFCLADPKWEDVHLLLSLYQTDYLLVYFSGHGFTGYDERRYFCFKNAYVEDTALFNDCPRQLIIGDACRTYMAAISGITPEEEISSYLGDQMARAVFDKAIINSPAGRMIIHSTQTGAVAYESNGKGGAFTLALLSAASSYCTGRPYNLVHISNLLPEITNLLPKGKYEQRPDIPFTEGNLRVPFLIEVDQTRIPNEITDGQTPIARLEPRRTSPLLKIIATGLIIKGILQLFDEK